jgi:lipopolysaccharide export system protein LptA
MSKIVIDGSRAQTLRTILIAAFAGVALVVLGVLGLKELKRHGLSLDLPGRLGVNIKQTANGFTYSQSKGGHTLFTIHASKIVKFTNDEAELHDVAITLYGPAGSRREDRITGSEFKYDQKAGTVTAQGSVEIDMSSPAKKPKFPFGSKTAPPDNIHVKTSGVTFNQNTGMAQTAAPLAFSLPRASGNSVGGSYNAKTGVLILQSKVELHADEGGNPAVIDAEHAELLRDAHIAYLLHADSRYEGGRESADEATVHFRPDGSLQHLDAQGHVHVVTADGGQLYASNASTDFDQRGQPLSSSAGGGVNFVSESAESNMHGNAVEGTLSFVIGPDGKAAVHHAHFDNAVSFVFFQRSLGGDPRGSATREMTASTLDIDFAPGPQGKSLATRAIAKGGAMVNLHDLPFGAPPRHTTIYGEQLVTTLALGHELRSLEGTGGTKVVYHAPDGSSDTTTGDLLHVTFASRPGAKGTAKNTETGDVEVAQQMGHFTMATKPAPSLQPAASAKGKTAQPREPLYAEAGMGVYTAVNNTLRLTGEPQRPPRVHNATFSVTANTIMYNRVDGETHAVGDVRSTYMSDANSSRSNGPAPAASTLPELGGGGAVHVVAASATLSKDTTQAVFEGVPHVPARLWQGANSVTAPVLELGKQEGTLSAHGPDGQSGDTVQAVFAGHGPRGVSAGGTAGGMELTRVAAHALFYSDSTRMADFKEDVVAVQPRAAVRAEDMQLFLSEAAPGQPAQLERLVAAGHVLLQQTGRRGTGEKLVYTAADGNYLLTGDAHAPPRISDAQHGDVTGAALLLHGSDNSVEVLSHDAEGNARRVVTDTRTTK